MTNREVVVHFRELRARFAARQVDPAAAHSEFERLAYQLGEVSSTDDRTLVKLVNAMELIRFGRTADHQTVGLDEVFTEAESLFARYGR